MPTRSWLIFSFVTSKVSIVDGDRSNDPSPVEEGPNQMSARSNSFLSGVEPRRCLGAAHERQTLRPPPLAAARLEITTIVELNVTYARTVSPRLRSATTRGGPKKIKICDCRECFECRQTATSLRRLWWKVWPDQVLLVAGGAVLQEVSGPLQGSLGTRPPLAVSI